MRVEAAVEMVLLSLQDAGAPVAEMAPLWHLFHLCLPPGKILWMRSYMLSDQHTK